MRSVKTKIRPYLMVAPAMAGLLLFTVYPIFRLIQLSLMDVNMLDKAKSKFVGFRNFQQIFVRPDFGQALSNTFVYTVAVVFLITAISLVFAVWLNSTKSRLNNLLQGVIFFPNIVSIVSVSLVWLWMMEPTYGLFNYLLRSFSLPTLQWLSSSHTAMPSIILVSVWKSVGYDTLIYLAALQSVSPNIYEAVSLDCKNKFTVFFQITLPMISPLLFFTLIIRVIDSFKMFDTVRVMTEGGPNNATMTLVYEIYNEALQNVRIGYSSAIGVVLLIIISVLTLVYFKVYASKVHYQ